MAKKHGKSKRHGSVNTARSIAASLMDAAASDTARDLLKVGARLARPNGKRHGRVPLEWLIPRKGKRHGWAESIMREVGGGVRGGLRGITGT